MLFHFINVLLQVLLHKSHDLLQEEITVAIYNMASVDFDAFYSAFMPEFLNGCQGVDTSQRAVLARNFKLERVKIKFLTLMFKIYKFQVEFKMPFNKQHSQLWSSFLAHHLLCLYLFPCYKLMDLMCCVIITYILNIWDMVSVHV